VIFERPCPLGLHLRGNTDADTSFKATLVACKWKNCAWSFPLLPSINTEHYPGQAEKCWLACLLEWPDQESSPV